MLPEGWRGGLSADAGGYPARMIRVGHGGAGALARANTLASFDAAADVGVDMVEFDVRAHGGELVLAHYPWTPRRRACPTLREALRHLGGPRFADMRFDVDLKSPGAAAATLYALESAGLTDRCLISSQMPGVLDDIRRLDPSVRTGISVGGVLGRRRQGWQSWRADIFAALRARRFDALMAHHALVDSALADGVRERGAELFAWTVDDRRRVEALRALGVGGVITNDPRLFAPPATA